MNLIYEKVSGVRWYSDLQPFVAKCGARINEYWWRFDDVDAAIELPKHTIANQCWVLTGHEFASLVQNHPQFIWTVVSAISTNLEKCKVDRPVEIYADGNPNFWHGSPTPQHPDASFEIVCWDASATLLIGADQKLANAFLSAYPGARDLDAENADRNSL